VVLSQRCVAMRDAVKHAGKTYPFPLLCDEDRKVIKAYGVWHPIGIDAFNVAHPASFLIDAKRKVRYSFVGSTQFARAPLKEIIAAAQEANRVR
jgi:peroxiredoxin